MREGSNVRRHDAGSTCSRPDRIPVLRASPRSGAIILPRRIFARRAERRSEACPGLRIARKFEGIRRHG